MKLSWIFGSSMAACHLLYSYLTVWIIQGGYATWAVWNWLRTKETASSDAVSTSHRL